MRQEIRIWKQLKHNKSFEESVGYPKRTAVSTTPTPFTLRNWLWSAIPLKLLLSNDEAFLGLLGKLKCALAIRCRNLGKNSCLDDLLLGEEGGALQRSQVRKLEEKTGRRKNGTGLSFE